MQHEKSLRLSHHNVRMGRQATSFQEMSLHQLVKYPHWRRGRQRHQGAVWYKTF
jgi:hypothetical protein